MFGITWNSVNFYKYPVWFLYYYSIAKMWSRDNLFLANSRRIPLISVRFGLCSFRYRQQNNERVPSQI